MRIVGYLKTSLIEWPGKISSVLFSPGCNFRCPFCHNRELVKVDNKKLKNHSEKGVLKDLKRRRKWIDGVCLTGGEPTLQPDLGQFLRKLRKMGFEVMLETNGSRPEVIGRLIENGLLDFVALDYKTVFSEYESLVKIPGHAKAKPRAGKKTNKKLKKKDKFQNVGSCVKQSLRIVFKSGVKLQLRTTLVPTIHDEQVLLQMAEELKELTARTSGFTPFSWQWQEFQSQNCLETRFSQMAPIDKEKGQRWVKKIRKNMPGVELRY
ncbi:anaerobic ribonucleoside-triphosphate reductase activating protein [Patescibacteria group bacterium]